MPLIPGSVLSKRKRSNQSNVVGSAKETSAPALNRTPAEPREVKNDVGSPKIATPEASEFETIIESRPSKIPKIDADPIPESIPITEAQKVTEDSLPPLNASTEAPKVTEDSLPPLNASTEVQADNRPRPNKGSKFTVPKANDKYLEILSCGVELQLSDYGLTSIETAEWVREHMQTIDGEPGCKILSSTQLYMKTMLKDCTCRLSCHLPC